MDTFQAEFDEVIDMQDGETSTRKLIAWFDAIEETDNIHPSQFQRMMKRNNCVAKVR